MCLSLLHFQPWAGSEPDYNCCLSNKYTYMQLRSPEVTRVNFHLSLIISHFNMSPRQTQPPNASCVEHPKAAFYCHLLDFLRTTEKTLALPFNILKHFNRLCTERQ